MPFLRAQDEGRPVDRAAFEACLNAAVQQIVARQCEIGLDIINDGEFGKTISWSRYILERLSGFEQRDQRLGDHGMPAATIGKDHRDFPDFYREYDATQGFTRMKGWAVTGPIRYTGMTALQRDINDLKAAAGSAPARARALGRSRGQPGILRKHAASRPVAGRYGSDIRRPGGFCRA